MAKFRSLRNETMAWLDKNKRMVCFDNGIAEIQDKEKKIIEEMKSRGYVDISLPSQAKNIVTHKKVQ